MEWNDGMENGMKQLMNVYSCSLLVYLALLNLGLTI